MAWVAFWTLSPAGSSESLDSVQAPELLDASSFGHGPDSVDSADFLDSLALEALRRLDVFLDPWAFLVVGSSGHAPLLLASSLAPDHAPLLSGDVRLWPEPGWDFFSCPPCGPFGPEKTAKKCAWRQNKLRSKAMHRCQAIKT